MREEAVALLEVKNAKIKELDIKINGIEPELNKLSVDRDLYKEYQNIIQQIDFLTRLHYSYEYIGDQEKIKKTELEIAVLEEEIKSFNDTTKSNEAEVSALWLLCRSFWPCLSSDRRHCTFWMKSMLLWM